MKFEDVLPALRAGRKIHLTSDPTATIFTVADLLADDWEVGEEYFDTNTVKKAYILTPSDYNITEFFNLFLNCLKEFYFKDNANEDICKALEKIKKTVVK